MVWPVDWSRQLVDYPHDTFDDVIDVGKIAFHPALIEYRDRLTGEYFPGEAEIRHVGPSPWTVHGEKTQAGAG